MEKSLIAKPVIYTVIAVALAFLCVAGRFIDELSGTEYVAVLFKTAIAAGIISYALTQKQIFMLWQGKYITPYLLFALIPAVFYFLAATGFSDSSPSASTIATAVVNTFITALWQELYFRYVGKSLFEKNGGYTVPIFIFLAAVFALFRFVTLLFYHSPDILLQTAVAFATSVFMAALYCKTRNIFVTVTGHFFMNSAAGITVLYVENAANRLLAGYTFIPVVLCAVFMLSAGIVIFCANGFLKPKI